MKKRIVTLSMLGIAVFLLYVGMYQPRGNASANRSCKQEQGSADIKKKYVRFSRKNSLVNDRK